MTEQSSTDVSHALRGLRGGPGRAVLLIEPNPDQQSRLARLVTVHGHRVIGTSSLDGALALLRAFPVDLVLVSETLVGADPVPAVAALVSSRPHARIVIMATGSAPVRLKATPDSVQAGRPHAGASAPGPTVAAKELRRAGVGAVEYIASPFTSEVLNMLLAG